MTKISDMYNDLQVLIVERDAASVEHDAAQKRFYATRPEVPAEICVQSLDDRMTLDTSWFQPPREVAMANGLPQTISAEGWRAMLADPPRLFGSDEVNERALERIRIGLAAAERYEAAIEEARRSSGLDAAEAGDLAASEAVWALERTIAAAVPETLADVGLKAAAFVGSLGGEKPDATLDALLRSLTDLPTTAAA